MYLPAYHDASLIALLRKPDGRALTTDELQRLRDDGVRYVPIGKACPGFDPVAGCPGHPATPAQPQLEDHLL